MVMVSTSSPNTSIVPERFGTRPRIVRVRTDLPCPDGPTKPRDLAAIDVEVEPLHHDLAAEADHEVAHADDDVARRGAVERRGGRGHLVHGDQKSMAAKNTAKSPSSTMTMKIDFTTEAVT